MLHSMKLQGKGSRLDALSHGVYDRRKLALAQAISAIDARRWTQPVTVGVVKNLAAHA